MTQSMINSRVGIFYRERAVSMFHYERTVANHAISVRNWCGNLGCTAGPDSIQRQRERNDRATLFSGIRKIAHALHKNTAGQELYLDRLTCDDGNGNFGKVHILQATTEITRYIFLFPGFDQHWRLIIQIHDRFLTNSEYDQKVVCRIDASRDGCRG